MSCNTEFFLGANTPKGFVSFFDELYNPYKTSNAYIIKGGPGTGKSTFMKKIADELEKRALSVERVYCASDPHSLDGVIAPEIGLSVADGTSPHVLEPRFPGVAENILNLGAFWDEKKLKKNRDRILSLTLENSLYHHRSSAYLAAAGSINSQIDSAIQPYIREDKIESFAKRFALREMPKKKKSEPGKRYKRFLSAITPEGILFFDKTVTALATRVFAIEDKYGTVGKLLAERIGEKAIRNGYDVIFCHCPMDPSRCEHIIIPQINLALISARKEHSTKLRFDRIIHSGRFLHQEAVNHKQILRFNRRLSNELIKESVNKLQKAKATHDELEKEYISAMDFDSLNKFCAETVNKITADI